MSEDRIGIIPMSERHHELEKEVKAHMSGITVPPQNKKKYYRIPTPTFKDERERTEWEKMEIDRCINGYNGLSPKMYYFLQYGTIITPKEGKTIPEYRTIQQDWFKKVEGCEGTGRGIVCVKRRRVGVSVLESFDALHDCSFNPHFKLGMNSKSERDSIILFNRVKLAYDNLPTFLRPRSSAGRSRLNMDFSYYVKDEKGNKIKKGLGSEIIGVAPTPTAYEGLMLRKMIVDEAGKQPDLLTMWTFAEPTLMQDTQRIGVPLFFGTAGDIDKDAKGLITLWKEHHVQNLDRFFFAGYNGLIVDEYGNDMIEDAVRWIIYSRHKKANTRGYKDFIQQYPITAEEAFMPSQRTGIGDIIQINAQMLSLESNPPVTKTGMFNMDASGIVHFRPTRDGKVVIYEHPDVNLQRGYIASCDPADNDDTQGKDEVSDLSLHILKKPHGTHPPKIVLEYVDRPTKLDEYYYQSALCLLYYNKSRMLVENNRYRMISDFQKMGYGYLLQPSPQSIHRIAPNATANTIGVRMTEPVRKYMISLIEQYLDNYINHVPSIRLLEQIKQYGMKNTDMVYSFGLVLMLLAEDRAPMISAEKAESMFDFSYHKQGNKIVRIIK